MNRARHKPYFSCPCLSCVLSYLLDSEPPLKVTTNLKRNPSLESSQSSGRLRRGRAEETSIMLRVVASTTCLSYFNWETFKSPRDEKSLRGWVTPSLLCSWPLTAEGCAPPLHPSKMLLTRKLCFRFWKIISVPRSSRLGLRGWQSWSRPGDATWKSDSTADRQMSFYKHASASPNNTEVPLLKTILMDT